MPDATPMTKRDKMLARQVKWRLANKEATVVALEDAGYEVYLVEKKQIVELMSVQVPKQCRCRTPQCEGSMQLTKATTLGHGGSVVMWFRCSGLMCSRTLVFHGSSQLSLDRTFASDSSGLKSTQTVGFMEVIISLMSGELYHNYKKAIEKRGGSAYNDVHFRDIMTWLYPYVERVLNRQCEAEHERMKVRHPECRCVSKHGLSLVSILTCGVFCIQNHSMTMRGGEMRTEE